MSARSSWGGDLGSGCASGLSDRHSAVEIWRVDLRCGDPPDWALLDARERAVADAFVHPEDRERYGRAHCALRRLLANILGVAPAEAPIMVGPSGKPFLADAAKRVTFNLSHTRNTALIAIGCGAAIGVDVEDDDGRADFDEMIDTVFEAATAERLRREEPGRRRLLFLQGWTRKEALAKALGSGFLIDPRRFAAPLDGGGPWTVRLEGGSDFGLVDLSDGAAIAALAVENFMPRLLLRGYPPR